MLIKSVLTEDSPRFLVIVGRMGFGLGAPNTASTLPFLLLTSAATEIKIFNLKKLFVQA